MPDQKLGRTMLRALKAINELIPSAPDARVEALEAERERLLEELGRLVDENLDQEGADYQAATAAMNAASVAIENALENMRKIAKAIALLGQALELAASLKP